MSVEWIAVTQQYAEQEDSTYRTNNVADYEVCDVL